MPSPVSFLQLESGLSSQDMSSQDVPFHDVPFHDVSSQSVSLQDVLWPLHAVSSTTLCCYNMLNQETCSGLHASNSSFHEDLSNDAVECICRLALRPAREAPEVSGAHTVLQIIGWRSSPSTDRLQFWQSLRKRTTHRLTCNLPWTNMLQFWNLRSSPID